jgi:hypothetical protein
VLHESYLKIILRYLFRKREVALFLVFRKIISLLKGDKHRIFVSAKGVDW